MDSSGSGVQGGTPQSLPSTSTRVDPEPAAKVSTGSGVQGDTPQPPQPGTPPPERRSPSEEANYDDPNAKSEAETEEIDSSVHMSVTEKKEMLADNLGYYMGNGILVAIVGDSALILYPWTQEQTDDLFLEISKK
eukprot:9664305-Karenia_brevis.AAC.1